MKKIEKNLRYRFENQKLLQEALTHRSYRNEHRINFDYERLELLGDAVIELVTTENLLRSHPDKTEGDITKLRASLVCEATLADRARKIDLGSCVYLGKGEAASGGADRDSLLCDVMESVIGAVYLDGGMCSAQRIIERLILCDNPCYIDYKTRLQEMLDAEDNLNYIVLSETGAEHDKTYHVAAILNGYHVGSGTGKSHKAAEQAAAKEVIELWE